MKNALSIDLEDWFCAYNLRIAMDEWDRRDLRVVPNTHRILDLFDRHSVQATFFVLGWIAERVPGLVQEIEERGHEVATHGYSHTLLTEMTPAEFEADLCRALEITRRLVTQPILGFRAPSFTITNKTLWAIDILARNGIKYDSSIFPIGLHPEYGMRDAPLGIHRIGAIAEVPMSVARLAGRNIPCSGGGYFRVFPYAITRFLLRQCNREGRPAVFYLHPWEVDPGQPRMQLSFSKSLRHYMNLDKTLARLDHLLDDFEFGPVQEVLGLSERSAHS
jgi:polysaccharide deacetylase family protein (PEP-CTERM system associated)